MLVLAALMDQLGIAKASLIGHSMGGRIAWTFAAAFPARVDKLPLGKEIVPVSSPTQFGRVPA